MFLLILSFHFVQIICGQPPLTGADSVPPPPGPPCHYLPSVAIAVRLVHTISYFLFEIHVASAYRENK